MPVEDPSWSDHRLVRRRPSAPTATAATASGGGGLPRLLADMGPVDLSSGLPHATPGLGDRVWRPRWISSTDL